MKQVLSVNEMGSCKCDAVIIMDYPSILHSKCNSSNVNILIPAMTMDSSFSAEYLQFGWR